MFTMFGIFSGSNDASGAAGRKQSPEEQRNTSNRHTREVRVEDRQERDGTLSGSWSGRGRDAGHIGERKTVMRSAEPDYDLVSRRELADASRYMEQNGRDIDDLRGKLEKEERQSKRLREERNWLREKTYGLEAKLDTETRDSNALQADVRGLQDQLAAYKNHKHTLETHLQSREKEVKTVQNELHVLRAQHNRILALLETRTSELKGAQAFLTTADSLSGAEVTKMVEGLNSEIFQTAAFIADSFEFEPMQAHPGAVPDAVHKMVADWIGDKTLHLLTSTRHSEDPMLIQIAVQSCLARYSKDIIGAWCFNMIPERFLVQVYDRMRQSEDQAVSGRWRALTRNYCRSLLPEDTIPSSIPHVIDSLANILIVASCKEVSQHIHDKVMNMFSDRIKLIANLALQLNRALGQHTSSDLEIAYFEGDIEFDPTVMVDICGDHAAQNSDRIICTTELGLLQMEKEKEKENKAEADKCLNQTILLKPKVALNSVTDSNTTR